MSDSTLTRRQAAMLGVAGVAGLVAAAATPAQAAQVHMDAALAALNTALSELEAAVPDKGGHRVRAIGDVRAAIEQVKLGISFAAH